MASDDTAAERGGESNASPDSTEEQGAKLREEYRRLNELFYGGAPPHLYFQHRLDHLLYTVAAPEKLSALELDYQRGPLRVVLESVQELDEEDRREFTRLAAVDAVVLLHHTAEALLRLYIAHEPLPPCPWLSVASLRSPKKFKRLIKGRFVDQRDTEDPTGLSAVLRVFAGTDDPEGLGLREAEWEPYRESAANIDRVLSHLARVLLDDAFLYNAAKHGLAVKSGEAFMYIDAHRMGEGPSVTYLAIKDRGGLRQWHLNTAWIEVEHAIAFTGWACTLMDSLWRVAKARYLRQTLQGVRLHAQPELPTALKGLAELKEGRPFMSRMSRALPIVERSA